jgi:hypothetical protein
MSWPPDTRAFFFNTRRQKSFSRETHHKARSTLWHSLLFKRKRGGFRLSGFLLLFRPPRHRSTAKRRLIKAPINELSFVHTHAPCALFRPLALSRRNSTPPSFPLLATDDAACTCSPPPPSHPSKMTRCHTPLRAPPLTHLPSPPSFLLLLLLRLIFHLLLFLLVELPLPRRLRHAEPLACFLRASQWQRRTVFDHAKGGSGTQSPSLAS